MSSAFTRCRRTGAGGWLQQDVAVAGGGGAFHIDLSLVEKPSIAWISARARQVRHGTQRPNRGSGLCENRPEWECSDGQVVPGSHGQFSKLVPVFTGTMRGAVAYTDDIRRAADPLPLLTQAEFAVRADCARLH